MASAAVAAAGGLIGYGAASNHPGGAFGALAKLWQAVGVAGVVAVFPGILGVLNVRFIDAWLTARPTVPAEVTVDGRGELGLALDAARVVRMQAWTTKWKVRRLKDAGSLWFAGDADRAGVIGTRDGAHLIAVTTVTTAFRPGRRPRP